jgi:hypothetical protein
LNRHGWALHPEGASLAASRSDFRMSSDTGSGLYLRILRRLSIASMVFIIGAPFY